MARPSSATERELIQEQLTQAKKTLARLRQISDTPTNGDHSGEWSRSSHNGDTRSNSCSDDGRSSSSHPRISTAARDNLVHALGYQVSKLEDDLKASLLAYFEQVERQKEDLIDSFNVMQQQLLNHQQTCQEQTLEAAEKDAVIRELKEAKRQLENEVDRLASERNLFDNSNILNGLNTSLESLNSESLSCAPSNNSGYHSDRSELSEKLMQENAKLREMLGQQDPIDRSRLERKVDLQTKLCDSYDKDLASKDILIKRLKAENKGLQYDVQCMQDEVLRVNASRLNAEQGKTKLQHDNHFKEEEIFSLREQLAEALEDKEEIQRYQTHSKTNNGDVSFPSVDEDLIELQNRCDTYKKKLHDKENAISSMKRDQQEMGKGLDHLKKELAEAKNEAQRMKKENERLQRENADRDIHRLSNESSAKASNTRINQLKSKLADAEFEIKELQHKCEDSEQREAALSQEVLSNLEKYTQTEQELYATKKELAQLRGYTESNDRYKDELQSELSSARDITSRLEKELRAKSFLKPNNDELDELQSDNRQLKDDIAQLEDDLNASKAELSQQERDMESLREQCSIQAVRLDGQETMIMRKDERIKELQDELVELHNQNDALMDEILKNNREYENLKMSKLLADQERELLKTGIVPTKGSQRESAMTPDSGYAESHRRDNPRNYFDNEYARKNENKNDQSESKDEAQKELDNVLRKNAQLQEQNAELTDTVNAMMEKLEAMQDKVENSDEKEQAMLQEFKEKEDDMLNELDNIKKQLTDLNDENVDLRRKAENLEDVKQRKDNPQQTVVSPRLLTFNELDALESPPVMDIFQEQPTKDNSSLYQEPGAARGKLIDFGEPLLQSTEAETQHAPNNANGDSAKEMQDMKEEIENYETQMESICEDKKELEAELEKLRDLLDKTQHENEVAQKEKDELENNITKDTAARDDKLANMEKELNSTKAKCKELKSIVEDMERSMEDKDKAMRSTQAKCKTLENQAEDFKKKYKEVKELADKAQEDTYDYEITKAKLLDLEHEIAESQGEAMDTVSKCRELQRDKRNLEEDIDLLQKDKNKMDKKLKEVEQEKDEISEKYEDAKRNIKEMKTEQRKLQEEKDDIDFDMNELLKQKNREIKQLIEDLDISDNKYEDLKATWDSTSVVTSDLKNDLNTTRDECADLTKKNEQLYELKKELVKELESKEKQIESLNKTEKELRNGINSREKTIEKLREKSEELKQENTVLYGERIDLKKAIDVTSDGQKAADSYVEKLREDLEKAQNNLLENEEKLLLLEEKATKDESENDVMKDKLSKMEKRFADLQKRDDTAQTELLETEKRAKAAEKKVKELTASLDKNEDDVSYLQNKLSKSEKTIASLEEAQSEAEEQQKALQRKLQDLTNQLNDLSLENKDKDDRQKTIDQKLTDLRLYNEEVEAERDDLEFAVKELKKKLEKQKKKAETLEDELLEKQREKDNALHQLDFLKTTASDTETEQNAFFNEKGKLKKDLLESSKTIMDLEAENDALKENIEELEKLLDQKRAAVLDLEDNMKETTESVVTLQVQNDENIRITSTLQEDNANLEKMLEKQRQLSEGYKSSLAQKDAEISKLAFSRDDTEDALQLLKKDLARREGANKATCEELEELENQLLDNNKKLQETKSANENLQQENERLQKELDNAKKRLIEMDSIQSENVVSMLELEPLNSRKSSSSSVLSVQVSGTRIKTLDEKLDKAQNKVTDLENELSKEIRRHEIDCIKTRPTLPYSYSGKRAGFYDVSGFNNKHGLGKKSDSSDSEMSSIPDDTKSREPYKTKKSMDSTNRENLDGGSDVESKGIKKSASVASSTPPQSPVISVVSYDSLNKQHIQDDKHSDLSINIQDDDSYSDVSSKSDDDVFDYSVGNLNDLLSEMNEAEKQDPILQQFLLDPTGPEGTSSPRADVTFDSIEPTYLERRRGQSNEPFDTTASDITTVTEINEPIQHNRSLINLEPLIENKAASQQEEPGVFDSDQPSDVIDPFSTPFDIPNWEDELSSSFDSSKELLDNDYSQSDNQPLMELDNKGRAVNDSRALDRNLSEKDNNKNNIKVGNDLDIKQDGNDGDSVDGMSHSRRDFKHEEPTTSREVDRPSDEEEEVVFRKPSEIIKQLENSSFNIGKPGMKPPRPKKRANPALWDDGAASQDIKPQPKPRDINHQSKEDSIPVPKQRLVDFESTDELEDQPIPAPKQTLVDLETSADDQEMSEEDRRTEIGRKRVLNLIAAFEGKEV